MAVEIGRRSLDKQIQPTADELEENVKTQLKEHNLRFLGMPLPKKNLTLRYAFGGAWKVAYADFVTGMMSLFFGIVDFIAG